MISYVVLWSDLPQQMLDKDNGPFLKKKEKITVEMI